MKERPPFPVEVPPFKASASHTPMVAGAMITGATLGGFSGDETSIVNPVPVVALQRDTHTYVMLLPGYSVTHKKLPVNVHHGKTTMPESMN